MSIAQFSAAAAASVKNVPPITVVGITLAGVTLNEWVLIATLVWLALQAGWFVWDKMIRPLIRKGAAGE